MKTILTIGDLKDAIKKFKDNDIVVVEIHEGVRHEDLYEFTIDEIDGLKDPNGDEIKEVRICI